MKITREISLALLASLETGVAPVWHCPKCGGTERKKKNAGGGYFYLRCAACERARDIARKRVYLAKHREEHNARCRAYDQKKREKRRAVYHRSTEEDNARRRRYYREHLEQERERSRKTWTEKSLKRFHARLFLEGAKLQARIREQTNDE